MNTKKNIDRLFQEKFRNFEVSPDDSVWEQIKARQHKKKKQRVILPFWYRMIGVAAVIAVLLTVGGALFQDDSTENFIITSTDSENIDAHNPNVDINRSTPVKKEIEKSEDEKTEYVSTPIKKNSGDSKTKIEYLTSTASEKENRVVRTPDRKRTSNAYTKKETVSKNNIVSNSGISDKVADHKPNDILPKKEIVSTESITDHQNSTAETKKENILLTPRDKNQQTPPKHVVIAENDSDHEKEGLENEKPNDSIIPENGKKSIFDAIPIKEEEAIAETKDSKKWSISPNIAPVYYDAIGSGSSIDPQFSDNQKNGETNLSYGVQVAYQIGKRLSLRSGVNKVDLSYNTEDVGFGPTIIGKNLKSIDYDPKASAIFVSDYHPPTTSARDFEVQRKSLTNTQNQGSLNQHIGYIEVPVEIKYAIINTRLGVHMIGGVSTLFLNNNDISIQAGDFESTIGEANNINEVSFSGNVGLGMDYALSDHFQVNVEPIFKYQFNAYNEATENIKSYYFGVYTGISFKF